MFQNIKDPCLTSLTSNITHADASYFDKKYACMHYMALFGAQTVQLPYFTVVKVSNRGRARYEYVFDDCVPPNRHKEARRIVKSVDVAFRAAHWRKMQGSEDDPRRQQTQKVSLQQVQQGDAKYEI